MNGVVVADDVTVADGVSVPVGVVVMDDVNVTDGVVVFVLVDGWYGV